MLFLLLLLISRLIKQSRLKISHLKVPSSGSNIWLLITSLFWLKNYNSYDFSIVSPKKCKSLLQLEPKNKQLKNVSMLSNLIRQSFKGYYCKSDIDIFVITFPPYSPFKLEENVAFDWHHGGSNPAGTGMLVI